VHRAGRCDRPCGGDRVALEVRPARPGEERALTELALRSKAHWGHDAAFIERARPELTVHPHDLERLVVRVAERDGRPIGFSALDLHTDPPELTLLFVDPPAIGTGAGTSLLAEARRHAAGLGIAHFVIESDPDAEPFYRSQGADAIGTRTSSATGRTLPLLRIATH
jgi:GNAT superfamily N-acetyltransferase